MKNRYLLFTLSALLTIGRAAAQPCPLASSLQEMHANNIRAIVSNNGLTFSGGAGWGLFPTPPGGGSATVSTLFASGLWMGGIDPGGNLKMAVAGYEPGFAAGPLDPWTGQPSATDCADWNRIFTVSGSEIAQFLAALNGPTQPTAAQYPHIFGWPARGNATFKSVAGFDLPPNTSALAPFFDVKMDGTYNPLDGDHPVVELRGKDPFVPAEISWCVFNDVLANPATQAAPMQLEVQQTVWAFDCPGSAPLNNTVFSSQKTIYRGLENIDSVSVGLWADFDLGCNLDDNLGCNPSRDCFFAYNTDAVDGSSGSNCGLIPTFSGNIPVQTAYLLNHKMEKFMVMEANGPSPISVPTTAPDYYHYLNGLWRDETPLTVGSNGYNSGSTAYTDFALPGDPSDPSGWSMCTANLPLGERSVVSSFKIPDFYPGLVMEINTAWTTSWPGQNYLPCSLGNALADADAVRAAYDLNFTTTCATVLDTKAEARPMVKISLSPNPASETVVVQSPNAKVDEIRLVSPDGRVVRSMAGGLGGSAEIPVGDLPAGVYLAQIIAGKSVFVEKTVVSH